MVASNSHPRVVGRMVDIKKTKNAKQDDVKYDVKLSHANMRPESHFVLPNLLRMMSLKDFSEPKT